MYKKILFNIKKIKNEVGGGAIFEPKTISMHLKRKEQKKIKKNEPGLEPTTSGLEKTCCLSH